MDNSLEREILALEGKIERLARAIDLLVTRFPARDKVTSKTPLR